MGSKGNKEWGEGEDDAIGRELVSEEYGLVVGGAGEGVGDGFDGVAPVDEVCEEVVEARVGLIGGGASAAERDGESHADEEVAIVVGVLGFHGLASGEPLVGVIGYRKVGLGCSLENVGGVVLVVGGGGDCSCVSTGIGIIGIVGIGETGAVYGDYEESIGGDDLDVGDVVDLGNLRGIGAEEVAYGGWGVVDWVGSEGQV